MRFDLRSLPPEFYSDPYPTYLELQSNSPVYALPDGGWLLTRYADIRAVYRDSRTFSSDKRIQFEPLFGLDSPLFEHHTTSLVFNDPPLHTDVRRAMGDALSSRALSDLQGGLIVLVDRLLDRLAAQQQVDLIADYAGAIPVEIIGNLLGVPHDERAPLRDWSLAILGSLEVDLSDAQRARGNRAVNDFVDYLRGLIRRKSAADAQDIIGRLLRWKSAGRSLSAQELHHQCIFLLNAGHETTTNLIGNGIELLLRHPGELARLKRTPALIDSAIEEILRFESSNQLGNRTTTRDTRIGDADIPADSVLTLCIGAANRDPDIFEAPDAFNIARTPNPHLAFGAGIHTCAGLNVARMEGRIAIQRFFQRFSHVELIEPPVRGRRARFRGFETLRVALREQPG